MAKTIRKSRIRSRNQNRRSRRNQVRKNKTKKVGGAGFFGNSSPSSSQSSSFFSKLPPGVLSPQAAKAANVFKNYADQNPQALASLKGKLSVLAPHVQNLAQTASPMAKQLANAAIKNAPILPAHHKALANLAVGAVSRVAPAVVGAALKNPEGAYKLGTTVLSTANRLGVKVF